VGAGAAAVPTPVAAGHSAAAVEVFKQLKRKMLSSNTRDFKTNEKLWCFVVFS
jgi:hypothetical protein